MELLLDSLQTAINTHGHARAANCKIVNDVKESCIIGNPPILQSALLNLVNNALEAIDDSGQVTVHAYSLGMNTVDIKVKDNGCGVPDEFKDKIFEPFFTTRSNGTGLGLAVVRAIARAHRGEIWLDSQQETGSAFIVRLPTL
jgi:two-component system sensor histidine kinase FlrB